MSATLSLRTNLLNSTHENGMLLNIPYKSAILVFEAVLCFGVKQYMLSRTLSFFTYQYIFASMWTTD